MERLDEGRQKRVTPHVADRPETPAQHRVKWQRCRCLELTCASKSALRGYCYYGFDIVVEREVVTVLHTVDTQLSLGGLNEKQI